MHKYTLAKRGRHPTYSPKPTMCFPSHLPPLPQMHIAPQQTQYSKFAYLVSTVQPETVATGKI